MDRSAGSRRPAVRPVGRAAGLVVATACGAALAGLPALSCSPPSSTLDGGDLLGVFDAGDAAQDAPDAARRDAGPHDAGRDAKAPVVVDAGPAVVREPSEHACVTPAGEGKRELRRTIGRPACREAQVLEWRDSEGAPRYACVVAPRGLETRKPLPLVVFFHGAEDDPTAVDKKTGLRKLASSFDLSGDPSHQGFVILAAQGRAPRGERGAHFDDGCTRPDCVDVATVDHFVAELSGQGIVDARRVYALGDGDGGHMAATWAMLRADLVAAFATFGADATRAQWSCAGPPPPALVLYRACDFDVPCESVEKWLRARDAQGAETPWARLGIADEEEPNCAVKNKCTKLKGQGNHRRWPKQREDDILRFFARHTLAR